MFSHVFLVLALPSATTSVLATRTDPFDGVSIIAHAHAAAGVNGSPADYRKGPYFQESVAVTNTSAPVWMGVSVVATNGGTNPCRNPRI